MITEKVAVVVGTRPGIIKMAPVVRALEGKEVPHFIIHTGQHYSPEMDEIFMRELHLSAQVLRVSSSKDKVNHGAKTAHMLAGTEELLICEGPSAVLVCGDANTNLAGGLAARKLNLILGHVESGLRSFDWLMPEEHNRVILDHISDLLFAPTRGCIDNLRREHVRGEIHLTGNTVVDAMQQHLEIAKSSSSILARFNLASKDYIILTCHREENVDNPVRLSGILKGAGKVLKEQQSRIVFAIHPRTEKRVCEFGFSEKLEKLKAQGLQVVQPVGYLDFLELLSEARLVMTDSGGIQEEACILGIPCVTLRESSERPETVGVGCNVLAGTDPDVIANKAREKIEDVHGHWANPFGDGHAAERMVDITKRAMREGVKLR